MIGQLYCHAVAFLSSWTRDILLINCSFYTEKYHDPLSCRRLLELSERPVAHLIICELILTYCMFDTECFFPDRKTFKGTLVEPVICSPFLLNVQPKASKMLPNIALTVLAITSVTFAAPRSKRGADCTTTINSLDDADSAGDCTTVNINSFTVPAGSGFNLDLADGTTVNMSQYPMPLWL